MEPIDIKSIDMGMADTISQTYQKYGWCDSAHAFESLYIWAKDMNISAFVTDDLFAARLNESGADTWFFPVGSQQQKKDFISERLKGGKLEFRYMTRGDVSFVEENFPGVFEIEPAPNDSEYVYDRDTIENLPGNGLSRKRRYIKQLQKEHTFRVKELCEETLPDIRYILDIWRKNSDGSQECNDLGALDVMLTLFKELKIQGIVVYMDDAPCSVAAGYYLSDDTVDACLQKSAINEHGLQYYVRQLFSSTMPPEVKIYNYEEDLGIEGLKTAKEFMHPCAMVDMFKGRQL